MPRAGFGSTTGHLVSNVQLTPTVDNQLWRGRWIPWKHHRHTIDVERVPDWHRHSVNLLMWGSHTVIVLGVPSLGQLSTGYSGLFDTGRHGARTISTVDLGLGNHFGSVRPALRARVTEYLVNPRRDLIPALASVGAVGNFGKDKVRNLVGNAHEQILFIRQVADNESVA